MPGGILTQWDFCPALLKGYNKIHNKQRSELKNQFNAFIENISNTEREKEKSLFLRNIGLMAKYLAPSPLGLTVHILTNNKNRPYRKPTNNLYMITHNHINSCTEIQHISC